MKTIRTLPENITNIITDSRRIMPSHIVSGDTAFVALRTGIGDGHRYIRSLYEKGLRCFIVDSTEGFEDLEDAVFIVACDGSLRFIIGEASKRLADCRAKQIVVTGSRRKTTVKELIAENLKRKGATVARSPRTWNSAMGIALSIFDNVARNPEWIVTEAAIDAPNQAARIAPMLRPEIGVITGITDEHDEAFASHAEKIAEKIALVRNAEKIVYVDDDPELARQLHELRHPNPVAVPSIERLVEEVTGLPCPATNVSTHIEIRRIPDNGILLLDSFTNDLESLPLSLALAAQRRAGREIAAFLCDFKGDRDEARKLVNEYGGEVFFVESENIDKFITGLHRNDFADRLIMIKGDSEKLATFFDEARHETTLKVDIDAIVHNYNVYRRLLRPGTGIIGMVKADAYGLGAFEVAKTLQEHGAAKLAVAVVDEGVELRKAGITMPIIVLNPITNRFEALVSYNLEPAVFSVDELRRLEEGVRPYASAPVRIHIKLDTGMHRLGFNRDDLPELSSRLKESPVLKVESVFSHLATADNDSLRLHTERQIKLFEEMSGEFARLSGHNVKKHLLNTAGITAYGKTDAAHQLARLGIGLYGISPVAGDATPLRPAASLVSSVISLKHYPEGTAIGYGRNGVTSRPSYIATVAIGYADGIDRRLGNGNFSFAVQGIECPTIGNICMDQMMVDVTRAVEAGCKVNVGTDVEIFGPTVHVTKISDVLGTIPYEILTSISPRVRRTYHQR